MDAPHEGEDAAEIITFAETPADAEESSSDGREHAGSPLGSRGIIWFAACPIPSVEKIKIPATESGQRLQYFIHDDTDALRMEMSGSLTGLAARQAYEAWRTATFLADQHRMVVDISHLTDADETGGAILRAWQRENARIVASSVASRAIADRACA